MPDKIRDPLGNIIAKDSWKKFAQDLWWFVENVDDEYPGRNDLFFELRGRIRTLNQPKTEGAHASR